MIILETRIGKVIMIYILLFLFNILYVYTLHRDRKITLSSAMLPYVLNSIGIGGIIYWGMSQ